MKKTITLLLCAVLLLGTLSGCVDAGVREYTPTPPTAAPSGAPGSPAAEPTGRNYNAAFEEFDKDTVVLTVDGDKVMWDELFYWIFTNISQIESFMGPVPLGEAAMLSGAQISYGQLVLDTAKDFVVQYHVLDLKLREEGVTLTEDDEKKLETIRDEDRRQLCGEDSTDEDLTELLESMHISRRVYDFVNRIATLYARGKIVLYGADGEKLSDADVLNLAEEKGYMHAKHILFTTNKDDGSAMSEEEKAAQLKLAEECAKELAAITDKAELEKRFDELMKEKSQDPGKEYYGEGYCFTPGAMVPEFEEAVKSLEEYKVSEVVTSAHGYHVILRLPVTAEDTVSIQNTGEIVTLRGTMVQVKYDEQIAAWVEKAEVVWEKEFEDFDLAKLFGEEIVTEESPAPEASAAPEASPAPETSATPEPTATPAETAKP